MNCYTESTNQTNVSNFSEPFACDRARACQADILKYEFDWSDERTLNNWMTSLDLVCEQPYRIGLVGSINMMCVALGSVAITTLADKFDGRKPFLLLVASVTPVGLAMLLL